MAQAHTLAHLPRAAMVLPTFLLENYTGTDEEKTRVMLAAQNALLQAAMADWKQCANCGIKCETMKMRPLQEETLLQ